jgi:hypothetical protein
MQTVVAFGPRLPYLGAAVEHERPDPEAQQTRGGGQSRSAGPDDDDLNILH